MVTNGADSLYREALSVAGGMLAPRLPRHPRSVTTCARLLTEDGSS